MFVFSNKVTNVYLCERNISHIKNKQHLLWLQQMYESSIEKEQDETQLDIMFKIRDAISMKIEELERKERMVTKFF